MNQEKIKQLLSVLEGVKYYEWSRISQVIERKYNSESQRIIMNNTIEDSESLEKSLLRELDLPSTTSESIQIDGEKFSKIVLGAINGKGEEPQRNGD